MVRNQGACAVAMRPVSQPQAFFLVEIVGGKGSGLFVYSPSAAKGNLVDSISASGGTDPYGNVYLAGFMATGLVGGGPHTQTGQLNAGSLALFFDNLSRIEINNGGLFAYNPGGGLNNLIASIAQAAGTDEYGNAFREGITSYLSGAFAQLDQGELFLSIGGAVTAGTVGATAGGKVVTTSGLTAAGGDTSASLTVASADAGGLGVPAVLIGALAQLVLPSGLTGIVPATQSDATTFTIIGTGAAQASKTWTIAANDANAGTVYRLTVWGFGTEGSTAQNLNVGISLNGAVIRTSILAAVTASGSLRFRCVIDLHIVTTGAGGTADVNGLANWSTTGAAAAVSASANVGSGAAGGEAFNTTVSNTLRLSLSWSSTTGAPTITTIGSTFERIAA